MDCYDAKLVEGGVYPHNGYGYISGTVTRPLYIFFSPFAP